MEAYQYKLLIGGIGDDAHFIGIRLLELGFREAGFYVRNLGIRNTIDCFFEQARYFDIMLVSSKNGHAELYLDAFPRLLHDYKLSDDQPKLWYLGGSLSVSEPDHVVKKKYLNLGFTNVYPKPVSFQTVLRDINEDIQRYNVKKKYVLSEEKGLLRRAPLISYDSIIDRRWTREELFAAREKILVEWPTGEPILADKLPVVNLDGVTLDDVLWANHLTGKAPLFQPRTGVADIEEQTELLKYLEIAGSDVSSVQLDAASRSKHYAKAEQGRDMSIDRRSSVLNGFPVPVYGIVPLRKMIRSLRTPFQLRGGGPDHRFTYEIALHAGVTGLEGGFLCYLLPYDKLCSPTDALYNWQYVDRLCAYYHEIGNQPVNREYFGVLTASLITPSLAIVVNIIQSILSAQQGVASITVGYAEQGNRPQDIAAIQVMKEMVTYYLHRYKYYHCRVTTVFHQYMAAFPSDYKKAEELIFESSITATLSGATKVMVKTAVEATGIPDRSENGKAVQLCKKAAMLARGISVDQKQVEVEKSYIRKEVKQWMEAIIELGNNSISTGAIKAIEQGIIDVPWSPNIYNQNKVMGIRDAHGAIRFLHSGNIPFDEEIKEFHAEKVHVRKTMERDSSEFSLLEKDISRIWKNDYKKWPLDSE